MLTEVRVQGVLQSATKAAMSDLSSLAPELRISDVMQALADVVNAALARGISDVARDL